MYEDEMGNIVKLILQQDANNEDEIIEKISKMDEKEILQWKDKGVNIITYSKTSSCRKQTIY